MQSRKNMQWGSVIHFHFYATGRNSVKLNSLDLQYLRGFMTKRSIELLMFTFPMKRMIIKNNLCFTAIVCHRENSWRRKSQEDDDTSWWNASQQTQSICKKNCTLLAQRRRRWAGIVQMLYNCFEFGG